MAFNILNSARYLQAYNSMHCHKVYGLSLEHISLLTYYPARAA